VRMGELWNVRFDPRQAFVFYFVERGCKKIKQMSDLTCDVNLIKKNKETTLLL